MSLRAACRLQTHGFNRFYDYVLGKADWLAHELSTEGTQANVLPAKGPAPRGCGHGSAG
jgi:hypothetical protein